MMRYKDARSYIYYVTPEERVVDGTVRKWFAIAQVPLGRGPRVLFGAYLEEEYALYILEKWANRNDWQRIE